MTKVLHFFSKHKFIIAVIIVIIIAGGYYINKSKNSTSGETRYVLAATEKGTILTSVTGTGQVSVFRQIDVKPKASGEVTKVTVEAGQTVKTGQILAYIDSTDQQKSVRDAQLNLDSANLSMEKLKQPTDPLEIAQAENALTQAKENLENAKTDQQKAYDDGYTAVSDAFLDLPSVMSGLNDIVLGFAYSDGQQNVDFYYDQANHYDDVNAKKFRDDAYNSYQTARAAYDKNFNDYKASSRNSDNESIESIINETYNTTKSIAEAVKNVNNLIQFYEDLMTKRSLTPKAMADTQLTSLNNFTSKTNSHLSSLYNSKQNILDSKQNILENERTVSEKSDSLDKLNEGPDALDLRAQELTIKQRVNSLNDAKSQLADYVVKAPFDGVLASVDAKKGDTVSTGDTFATLITKKRIAEISLNEIDAVKVAVGQKATLTFDAIDELSITGEVSQVDLIGTVSQGVVSYNVQISFDTDDDRVKAGMSVSASIITEAKQDILIVPSTAIKEQGDISYVETIDGVTSATDSKGITSATLPTQKQVEVGLSDDTSTEITSGLNEGDMIITKTITSSSSSKSTTTTTKSATSLFGIGGGGGGGMPSGGGGPPG